MRRFNNPFGWDWMPRNEEVFDITSGTNWSFNAPWAFHYDKFDELRKVAKTFEDIKKVEINLTFDLDPKQKELTEKDIPLKKRNRLGYKHNQLKSIGNKFYINVNTTDERYLTTEAKLDHNVSHILYDSPIKESRQHAHRLSLGHGIPELLRDEKLAISPDCNLCEDVIRHVFDILEDVRVNSLWGDIYMGTQNDYDECKDKVKKQLKKPITNPIQALWYAANGKTDDSEMSKIALQFINDIKHTDYPAGPLLQKAYFEEVILPWLKEQPFDDDNQKYDEFMSSSLFPFYKRVMLNKGFKIWKHCPYVLVADIGSPAIVNYLNTNIEDTINTYYNKSYNIDYIILLFLLVLMILLHLPYLQFYMN